MSATLSELSDQYGITKVTAKSRLISLNLWDEHAQKEGRRYIIDDYALGEFAKNFEPSEKKPVKKSAAGAKAKDAAVAPAAPANEDLVAELRDMVEYLKRQLAQKDDLASKQLAEKDEQIARRDEQISRLIEQQH